MKDDDIHPANLPLHQSIHYSTSTDALWIPLMLRLYLVILGRVSFGAIRESL